MLEERVRGNGGSILGASPGEGSAEIDGHGGIPFPPFASDESFEAPFWGKSILPFSGIPLVRGRISLRLPANFTRVWRGFVRCLLLPEMGTIERLCVERFARPFDAVFSAVFSCLVTARQGWSHYIDSFLESLDDTFCIGARESIEVYYGILLVSLKGTNFCFTLCLKSSFSDTSHNFRFYSPNFPMNSERLNIENSIIETSSLEVAISRALALGFNYNSAF